MPWRVGTMAALLAWLLLASPAGAAIQRHTDSQGVIHISNGVPAKEAPNPPENPNEAPSPEALVSLPEPAAPPAAAAAPAPVPETSAPAVAQESVPTEKPQPALEANDKVCQGPVGGQVPSPPQRFIGLVAAAATAAAKSVAPATNETAATTAVESAPAAGPEPLKRVSYEADEDEDAAAPEPKAATPKAAEIITAGGIRRYRDGQGVWHISNVAPGAEGPGPVQLAAEKRPSPEKATPEQPRRPAAGPPLRQVSWSPDAPDLATLPTTMAKAKSASPGEGSPIRRYRDSKGVIHIDNVEPEAPPSLPPPAVQARAGPGADQPAKYRHAAFNEEEAPLVLKPVAWSGEGAVSLPARLKATSSGGKITTEGGIQRWRDKQGVWHVKTVEYPRPEALPGPPRQAEPKAGSQVASAPALPMAPGPPAMAGQSPPTGSGVPGVPTITAFRDRQGRLRITNDGPVAQAPPPGAAPAPAELEPFIADAAQVYRLPPTLVRAVIKVESNFCSWAVSPKGAMGLMQLMPGTAAFLGVQEPFNPRENIHGGCRYLRLLLDFFGGNVPLALAGYNAGYQRVINCGFQVPPIKETQDFVTQVMGRYVAEEKRTRQPWT